MKREKLVIVIGRQFGSGGRQIGKKLAERLDLDYYDRELLSHAASDMGFSTEIFSHADEKKPSVFNRVFMSAFGVQQTFVPDSLTGEDLYTAQSRIITQIGEKGNCVIIGRTADHLLRESPNLISVFLHAPVEYRAKIMMSRGDHTDYDKCKEIAIKNDRRRESYYNYFTGRKWGHADNYDICINSSYLEPDDVVSMISEYVAKRIGK